MININNIAIYFPQKKYPITELKQYPALIEKEQAFFSSIGINTISIAEDESATDMAVMACRDLLRKTALPANKIDYIIYIKNRQPELIGASEVTNLKEKIGANNAFCFTQSGLGCVDFNSAILLAEKLLKNDDKLLIAYGNKPYVPNRFRYPSTIIGDGGFAVMLSKNNNDGIKILDGLIETNGDYWDLFQINYKQYSWQDWKESYKKTTDYSFKMAIESCNRFEKINNSLFKKNNITIDGIDAFMMQNISTAAYNFYETRFNIKFDNCCKNNLGKFGHLGPMDIALNIYSLLQKHKMTNSSKLSLVMNNSPAAAWSSVLIEI